MLSGQSFTAAGEPDFTAWRIENTGGRWTSHPKRKPRGVTDRSLRDTAELAGGRADPECKGESTGHDHFSGSVMAGAPRITPPRNGSGISVRGAIPGYVRSDQGNGAEYPGQAEFPSPPRWSTHAGESRYTRKPPPAPAPTSRGTSGPVGVVAARASRPVDCRRPPQPARDGITRDAGRRMTGGDAGPTPWTRLHHLGLRQHGTPAGVTGRPPSAGPAERRVRPYLTRPYQTLRVQIRSLRTVLPGFGECQILPFPA